MDTLYDAFMSPLEKRWLREHRSRLVGEAQGSVLEIGFGTGANMKYYVPEKILSLTALDLAPSTRTLDRTDFAINYVTGQAEKLPFEDACFDTVVETLVLCSVSDLKAAVAEIFRVLKFGGRFVFMDHVLPEQKGLRFLFNRANGVWPHIAQGCNLNREPHRVIESVGFMMRDSGSFAKGVFRYGVAEKPFGGQ